MSATAVFVELEYNFRFYRAISFPVSCIHLQIICYNYNPLLVEGMCSISEYYVFQPDVTCVNNTIRQETRINENFLTLGPL